MASATLEMILKLTGVNKTTRGLDKVSDATKQLDGSVKNSEKANAKFSSGMSGLQKTAIAGGAIFAAKSLLDFSKSALDAAVSAEEAASAFGTTFATAADRATIFLEDFANKAGLTVSEAQQLNAILGSVAQGIGFTAEESADLAIELTTIAADIASFMNVAAGAAPVLQSFQRALVGERESLATYGIKISELEVQTKALAMSGKENAEQLTRQEKGYATIALITEKAGVQIGDLDRTLEGFANQSRMVGAEIRELKEDIGRQLIPAAEELLPVFRNLIENVTPSVIAGFAGLGNAVVNLVLALDRLGDVDGGVIHLIKNFSTLADEQRKINEVQDRTNDNLIVQRVQQSFVNQEIAKNRQQTIVQRSELEKFNRVLKKDSLPAIEKYLKFMNLLTQDEESSVDSSNDLRDAKDNLTEAQRREALSTAEEALQKKELQKQIAELLFFQRQGVNVSEELAVAQEKLRLVEFELTRESEDLRDAKQELNDLEAELMESVNKATTAIEEQFTEFSKLNEQVDLFNELAVNKEFMRIMAASGMANPFLATGLDLMGKLAKISGLDDRARELERFADAAARLNNVNSINVPTSSFTMPQQTSVPMFGQQELAGFQAAGAPVTQVTVQIGEEQLDDIIVTSTQRSQDKNRFFSDLVIN